METPAPANAAASASAFVASGSVAGSSSSSGAAAAASVGPALAGRRFVLNLPPGFHFAPTDAELVVRYLRPKLAGHPPPLPIFLEERVLDYHPEQLVAKYRDYGEDRWFFFTRRERKHEGGKRPNRTTPGNGHWNATGSQRPIYADGALVGCVGTLVFYEASRKKRKEEVTGAQAAAPDEDKGKTDWTMYEYESLSSEAEFEAKRNGEGKIDELVLCTIQKKKHCEQSKEKEEEKGEKAKKKRKKKDQEGIIPADGNSENTGSCVGGNKEKKGSRASGVNDKKGSPAGGAKKRRSRKEIAQEQEDYVKKILMAAQPRVLAPEPFEADNVKTDPYTTTSHFCSVTPSSTMLAPSQEMMLVPAAGTLTNSFYPNNEMHQNFSGSMMESLQAPMQEAYLANEQSYFYLQHMQHNMVAPPQVYSRGFGPEYSDYGYGNASYLLGTNMDYRDLSRFQAPSQPPPPDRYDGSTSARRKNARSAGYDGLEFKPK